MKQTLQKYAELKIAIKELEAEEAILKADITEYMQNNNLEEVEITDMGTITMSSRRSWTYSPATTGLEQTLKEQKKKEEQTGQATYKEGFFPMFKQKKND